MRSAPQPAGSPLAVLDSTVARRGARGARPATIPQRTLFIVSSKSGARSRSSSFEKHFFEWVRAARGAARPGAPSSRSPIPARRSRQLAARARLPPRVPEPGRHRRPLLGALLLRPGARALLGVDLAALLDHAALERRRRSTGRPAAEQPGVALGAALGELALARPRQADAGARPRDRAVRELDRAARRREHGQGRPRHRARGRASRSARPTVYGGDRVFVAVSLGDAPQPEAARARRARAAPGIRCCAGEPGLDRGARRRVPALGDRDRDGRRGAGRRSLRRAQRHRGQAGDPGGAASASSRRDASRRREPVARRGDRARLRRPRRWSTRCARASAATRTPAPGPRRCSALARPGDYVALLAYVHRTAARHERLAAPAPRGARGDPLRHDTRLRPALPALDRPAPQGRPDRGVFLLLTARRGRRDPDPGRALRIRRACAAQAAGDYQVLERRGRRVVRVHLGADVEGEPRRADRDRELRRRGLRPPARVATPPPRFRRGESR